MNEILTNRENHTCKQGEVNVITKEIYCNRYHEFCKYIDDCPVKQNNQ